MSVIMKSSGIGGQAVIEGVMMRNGTNYSVAVRKPDGEIVIKRDTCRTNEQRALFFRMPIIRGMAVFLDALILGTKTLDYSTRIVEEEEEKEAKSSKEKAGAREKLEFGLTIFLAIIMAVAMFLILPFGLSMILRDVVESDVYLTVIEGLIRVLLFIGYIYAISMVGDIRRVFMYHGAEHKVINCVENNLDLNVANVRKMSRRHKRCGTSFVFVVMFISIFLFVFIHFPVMWLRLLSRIVLVPVVAGISYEFIKIAGDSDNKIINILSMPGLWIQGMTTKEPDDMMIEVAISSVEAVFDWKEYNEAARHEHVVLETEKKDTGTEAAEDSEDTREADTGSESKKSVIVEEVMVSEDEDEEFYDDTDDDEDEDIFDADEDDIYDSDDGDTESLETVREDINEYDKQSDEEGFVLQDIEDDYDEEIYDESEKDEDTVFDIESEDEADDDEIEDDEIEDDEDEIEDNETEDEEEAEAGNAEEEPAEAIDTEDGEDAGSTESTEDKETVQESEKTESMESIEESEETEDMEDTDDVRVLKSRAQVREDEPQGTGRTPKTTGRRLVEIRDDEEEAVTEPAVEKKKTGKKKRTFLFGKRRKQAALELEKREEEYARLALERKRLLRQQEDIEQARERRVKEAEMRQAKREAERQKEIQQKDADRPIKKQPERKKNKDDGLDNLDVYFDD